MNAAESGGNYINYNINKPRNQPKINSCGYTNSSNPWCNDTVTEVTGPGYISRNQHLTGNKQNPRTLVAPVITPPSYDFTHWRKNELNAYPSIVNRPSQQDLYLSGYVSGPGGSNGQQSQLTSSYNPYSTVGGREAILAAAEQTAKDNLARQFNRQFSQGPIDESVVNGEFIETAADGAYRDPFRQSCQIPVQNQDFTNAEIKNTCDWGCTQSTEQNFSNPEEQVIEQPLSQLDSCSMGQINYSKKNKKSVRFNPIIENFEYGTGAHEKADGSYNLNNDQYSPNYPLYESVVPETKDPGPDFVNKACGYDASNTASALPVNTCTGTAQKEPGYINYNKNAGTQIVQPGMYYTSQVLDPISSNIGITHSQQFAPQTVRATGPGQVLYTDHDPEQFTGHVDDSPPQVTGEELENIYDPRYTGYGSNDRQYIDPMTGQPRFFYDDIDAVKQPSYIVRSNVDHLGEFDQTGAMKHGEIRGDYRHIANEEFLQSTLDMRSDIQTKLAQKNYSRTEQLRRMPLSNTGRMRGR